MACKKKTALFAEYNQSVNEWAQAVQRLKDAGTKEGAYLELLSLMDDARAKTHRAKTAHAKHIAEHGC